MSCRYCLNTFESAQGRGVHEAAIHKVQRGVDGDCLWRQTRRREDLLRPWDGVGRGRCWVVRFSNTTEGGSCDSGPNSAAVFVLKPIQYLRTNLKCDGFSPPQPQPNKPRGAGKRRRYTFREKANVIKQHTVVCNEYRVAQVSRCTDTGNCTWTEDGTKPQLLGGLGEEGGGGSSLQQMVEEEFGELSFLLGEPQVRTVIIQYSTNGNNIR